MNQLILHWKKLREGAKAPSKAERWATCYDLYCPEKLVLDKSQVYMGMKEPIIVPLGIAIEIPKGYSARVYPRSSMPLKYHAILANSVGIIDAGYIDEWKLIITPVNWTEREMDEFCKAVYQGVRLAQVEIVENSVDVEFVQVQDFGQTYNRGGGLGSTGD